MEWEKIEAKAQRYMKWMEREAWLIVSMLFLLFIIGMVYKVALDPSLPIFGSPSTLFGISFLSTGRAENLFNPIDEPAIKATSIVGREAVKRFHAHLDCFSESGKWVYDPTPRHIPWNYVGDPYANVCDNRHLSSGSDHISGDRANDIATGGAAGNWSIREELKWVWQTNSSCPWRSIDRDNFCQKVGANGHIMVVGDSINHEIQWSVMNALITNGSGYDRLDGRTRSIIGPYEMCSDMFGKGRGFDVAYICNVHLTTVEVVDDWNSIEYPWIDLLNNSDIKILLLNRGAHYQDDEVYTKTLREVFTLLTERYPHIQVIYRNTEPGHKDCMIYTEPLSKPQEEPLLPAEYHWGQFNHQNLLAKELVEEFSYIYMDVYAMLSLRPDSHISAGDCLHYCLPGPIDIAAEYLYNILLLID